MKSVWIVYPYGDIIGEKFMEARHIRFGRVLAQNGYKVIFWTANFSHAFKTVRSDGWKTIDVSENFEIVLVPSNPYKKNISFGRARFEINYSRALAIEFQNREQPDLIITSGTGLATAFYPVWPYVKDKDITVLYDILDVHLFNSYMDQHHKALAPIARVFTKYLEIREKPFYHRVDAVCGLGKNQVELAVKRTGKKDIPSCLVYNSIVVEEFRNKMELSCKVELPQKSKDDVWCVYAGSLGPSYDIDTILECAEESRKNNDRISYIIAGAGSQEKKVEESSRHNPHVIYIGAVDPNWLPAIYKQCDIGLCTYASYSTVDMPDKFYDYTAAGLAIVNSLQGEVKEYVEKIGIQYEAENYKSLNNSIHKVIEDLNYYKKESYLMAERFDFNNQMKPLLALIKDLLSR